MKNLRCQFYFIIRTEKMLYYMSCVLLLVEGSGENFKSPKRCQRVRVISNERGSPRTDTSTRARQLVRFYTTCL